jgi:hypothetical protein
MNESRETLSRAPDAVAKTWQQFDASFERFCLTAGVSALNRVMEQDAVELCGPRHDHKDGKAGHRWGKSKGKIGFHGGKVSLEPPGATSGFAESFCLGTHPDASPCPG